MDNELLLEIVVYLTAAVIAAPLAKRAKIGSVLGYLIAGLLIGPFGLGFVYTVYQVETVLHIAELGVVFLLFLIGLELKPQRLIAMRRAVFGAGALQLIPSAIAIIAICLAFGLPPGEATVIGLALSLSSTAFVIQVLDEKKELQLRHGRLGFSILLFQDLAAIPIIALVPALAIGSAMLAGGADASGPEAMAQSAALFDVTAAGQAIGIIVAVILIGRFALGHVYRLVAASGVREAMTATALLTVVGVALLMQIAGLSAGLGAFIAGALLADSEYRHQIEADLSPFEGLLLGLFFTAIGMSLNLNLLVDSPVLVVALTAGLIGLKGAILYGVGRVFGLDNRGARRLALAVSQGGEFAFVIMTAAYANQLLSRPTVDLITVVVVLSMMATPILLLIDEMLTPPMPGTQERHDDMPDAEKHVVIAGFGRFAQITARILQARGIPFTALETSAQQVDFVRQFGNKVYYGDPSRVDVLRAADVDKASAFVLAVDSPEQAVRTAELVRHHYPHVPIYARARDRRHAHELMEAGVTHVEREMFQSSLALTRSLLLELGMSTADAEQTVRVFEQRDLARLKEDAAHFRDMEKILEGVRREREELEQLFRADATPDPQPDHATGAPEAKTAHAASASADAADVREGTLGRAVAQLDEPDEDPASTPQDSKPASSAVFRKRSARNGGQSTQAKKPSDASFDVWR